MDTSEIVKQGTLGVLLAFSLSVNYWAINGWLKEKDKRIEGAEKLRDDIALRDKYIQEAMALTTSKIRVSKEAQNVQAD